MGLADEKQFCKNCSKTVGVSFVSNKKEDTIDSECLLCGTTLTQVSVGKLKALCAGVRTSPVVRRTDFQAP